MNNDTIVILAAAGVGLYLIAKMVKPGAAVRPPNGSGTAGALNNYGNAPVTEINNTALPGQIGWGWSYYSDGTAIGPDGKYYLNGQLIWSPGGGNMALGG
ncbi:hypothetical protein [Simplicispira suum]|uniref:Uncharacterized protein n=1 Tax=Simplicispira suum TaxID=2109915 RepID=A0A2S0N3I8_9BURK|nr:hypothetical protein [Simplicispira suum]AVO42724.1 hypothetical protein C6571_16760 [Simplicispira suum]